MNSAKQPVYTRSVDLEQLPALIILTLVCTILALGLWYLGLRRNTSGPKVIAVAIGFIPVLTIGLQFASPKYRTPDYRSVVMGPTSREAATSTSIPLPVIHPEIQHELQLTPNIRGGNPPDKPVHLKFQVRSPQGETIAEGEGNLAPTQRLRWLALKAQFQPRQKGEHTLTVEIPQPVSSVDVIVRELDK